jgi:hypothetical protein
MASEWAPDHPDGPAEAQITVVVHRGERLPLTAAARAALVAAALLAVIGVVAISGLTSAGSPRADGVPGTGGSFGYPFRCVSVAFAPNGAGVARATVSHGGLCDHYASYVSATFRRVDGQWRLSGR